EVPAESAVLAKRFADAAAKLRESGASLYDLPWYIIIGPPGTGKSTLIENSGLRFPLGDRDGRKQIEGFAGTRNCYWRFTGGAILLDTAGRYTTQDADTRADREGWLAFLGLLKKYRRRRPINGVLIAFSADQLGSLRDDGLAAHAETIRKRLDEL